MEEESGEATFTSKESIALNTVIDDAVEFVTKISGDKSSERVKWVARDQNGERKIPEISDPAVAKQLNRLTISQDGNIRRKKKPENTLSRKSVIARSRVKLQTEGSKEANNSEFKKVNSTKLDSRSAIRSRKRRPPGFRHEFGSENKTKNKDSFIPKSIKRMRIKNKDRKIATDESRSNKQTEGVNAGMKPKKIKPSRSRNPTVQRSQITRVSSMNAHSVTPVRRLRNHTARRGHSTTTTTTTTEKITIRPDAHKIRYTLDDSEYMDITSASPVVKTYQSFTIP